MRKLFLVLLAVLAGLVFVHHSSSTNANTQDKLEMFTGPAVAAGRVIVKYRH